MKVGRLSVDPRMLEARFAAGCNTRLCRGACCRSGVWLDVEERERVLAHAGLVRDAMDPGQPCCAATKGGPLTVFDTCGMELRHVLGAAGVSRLRTLAARRTPSRAPR